LTSALAGGEWLTSRPGRFTPGERAPGAHWIGGWVDLRAGLDDLEKLKFLPPPGLELQPVASRYTDYAIPAPLSLLGNEAIMGSLLSAPRQLLCDDSIHMFQQWRRRCFLCGRCGGYITSCSEASFSKSVQFSRSSRPIQFQIRSVIRL
jgi:hypothetical protein